MAYLTAIELKQKYSWKFSDDIIQKAIDYAEEQVLKYAFKKVTIYNRLSNTVLQLHKNIADSNFDYNPEDETGGVDENEITTTEFLQTTPYTVNNLQDNISSLTYNHPMGGCLLEFDSDYPQTNYSLQIEYYICSHPYDRAYQDVKLIMEYYVTEFLFKKLPAEKLQKGLGSWSMFDVSVSFDQSGIEDFLTKLNKQISDQVVKLKPFNTGNVRSPIGY